MGLGFVCNTLTMFIVYLLVRLQYIHHVYWIFDDLITIPSLCLLSTCWFNCITLIVIFVYWLVYVQYLHHFCHLFVGLFTIPSWLINEYFFFFTNVQIHLIRCYFCRGWNGFAWKWSWRSSTTSCHGRCKLGAWRVKVGVQNQWMHWYLHDKMIVSFTFGQQTWASNGGR